mgnify:CR=1 FL=1
MAVNFPSPASSGQTHTHNGLTWKFDGTTWQIQQTGSGGTATYTLPVTASSGDVLWTLTGTDGSQDPVKLKAGTNITLDTTNVSSGEFEISANAGTDTNTQYELKAIDSSDDIILRLDADASGTDDDVKIVAGNNITLTHTNEGQFEISAQTGSGGAANFLDLTDTPSSYSNAGGKVLKVNATPNGIEFVDELTYEYKMVDYNSSTGAGSGNDCILRLEPSTGSSDDIRLIAGSNVTLNQTGGNIEISASDTDTDTDNYVDGISLTGSTLTLTRTGSLADLSQDLASIIGNTTYDYYMVDHGSSSGSGSGNDVIMRLAGSDSTQDDIRLVAGTNIGLSINSGTGTITIAASGSTGPTTFLGLSDTPSSFSANKWLKVNSGGSALEWTDEPTGNDTTYDFYCSGSSDPVLRLDPSTGSNDDVTIKGGTDITVTRNSNTELEISYSGSSGGGGTPGGSNLDIQYNNNGSFGGGLLHYASSSSGGGLNFANASGTDKVLTGIDSDEFYKIFAKYGSTNTAYGSGGCGIQVRDEGVWIPGKIYNYTGGAGWHGDLGELLISGGTSGGTGWSGRANAVDHGKATVYGAGAFSHSFDVDRFLYFMVIAVGGGGGGGGGNGSVSGGGGASGGTVIQFGGHGMVGCCPAGASGTVGGSSAGTSSGNGNNGNATTCNFNGGSSYNMIAYGGSAGGGGGSGVSIGGAAGQASCSFGTYSTGVVAHGEHGQPGHSTWIAGAGGVSFFGGANSNKTSNTGGAPGGGGHGASLGGSSQGGNAGCVVILEF